MKLIGKILDIFLAYRTDQKKGIPVWKDPTIIGLIIGLIAFLCAQYLKVDMPISTQEGITAFVIAIGGRMSRPHVGVYKKSLPSESEDIINVDHGAS